MKLKYDRKHDVYYSDGLQLLPCGFTRKITHSCFFCLKDTVPAVLFTYLAFLFNKIQAHIKPRKVVLNVPLKAPKSRTKMSRIECKDCNRWKMVNGFAFYIAPIASTAVKTFYLVYYINQTREDAVWAGLG